MKILFFIDSLSGGGAEKVLLNLVNNMNQSKFDITVQTVFYNKDYKKFLAKGICYKSINKFKNPIMKRLFNIWYRICTQLKLSYPLYVKGDYDIEAAYLEFGPTKIISSSTNKKAKKLAWVHCDFSKKKEIEANVQKLRCQYKEFDRIICVSKGVKDGFCKAIGNDFNTVVLQNVIDEEEIYKKASIKAVDFPHGAKNFLAVGRLSPEKGFDRLIEACAMLEKTGNGFYLTILGDGSERETLEGLITKHSLNDKIRLAGFESNPYPYMKAADYIICSSYYEGLSTVAIEALLLNKVIITTECAGMRELLGDSEYGLITGNSTEDLYLGMKKLIEFPELEQKYKGSVKERNNALKKCRIINDTEEFFVSLMRNSDD